MKDIDTFLNDELCLSKDEKVDFSLSVDFGDYCANEHDHMVVDILNNMTELQKRAVKYLSQCRYNRGWSNGYRGQ